MINETLQIRSMKLNGRIIMPPMATARTADGYVNEDLLSFYRERTANKNISLIITEHEYISPEGKAHASQVSIADDSCIEGLKTLTETIHAGNTAAVAQINHAGNVAKNEFTPFDVDTMTPADIEHVIKAFTAAAVRAKKAGYDGVEIHSAHRYLLNQFYSPITNHRTDEYGPQSVENRTRVHLAVLKAVREAVGPEYPIFIRLGGCDYTEGGSTIEDAVSASVLFEQAGADCIDLSGGMCSYRNPFNDGPGYFKDMSKAVKNAVSIPVILTGGVTEVTQAESLLNENAADMIGVGRALYKNADWEN